MGVFQKVKGSNEWWIRYADQYGRIHREKVGLKSLAQKAYALRKTHIREGKFFPDLVGKRKDVLFKDMARLYLEEHSKVNKRSYPTDCHNMRRLVHTFGEKALSEITAQDIERFKAKLAQEVSIATTNRHLQLLNAVFNKAITWGKTKTNPVRSVKKFKENNERVRYLTEDEESCLRTLFPEQHWLLIEVALHTGMRRGEQLNLKWKDVDFLTRTITIPRSKPGEKRHVKMNNRVAEILRGLPSRLKSEWIFPSQSGASPINANNFINRVFTPALKQAKIANFRWHDLRHTFASRLTMAGVDLRTVQELMGHKTIAMTVRYSHLSPAHTLDAVNKLCQDMKSGSTRTDTRKEENLERERKSSNSWWSQQDSNLRPLACEASALTS